MIHIGAIRKIFRGWRILICAWVDDNSPLKSQFFMLFRGDNGKEYIRIGKGYDPKTDTYPRMVVTSVFQPSAVISILILFSFIVALNY